MKRSNFALLGGFMALTVALCISSASAQDKLVPRKVLIEEATNWSCGPCAQINPVFEQWLQKHVGNVIHLCYHPHWPGDDDPMYQNDIANNEARVVTYYKIGGVPEFCVDGTPPIFPQQMYQIEDPFMTRLCQLSPLEIGIVRTTDGSKVDADVTVKAIGDMSAYTKLYLRFAAAESFVEADGPNGEKEFVHAMRSMYPNAQGTALTIAKGETKTFHFSYTIRPDYVPERLFEVAFVQSDATHEVLQAQSSMNEEYTLMPEAGSAPVRKFSPDAIKFNLTNNLDRDRTFTAAYMPLEGSPWTATLNGQTVAQDILVKAGASEQLSIQVSKGAGRYSAGYLQVQPMDDTTSAAILTKQVDNARVAFASVNSDTTLTGYSVETLNDLHENYIPLTTMDLSMMGAWNASDFPEIILSGAKQGLSSFDKLGVKSYLASGGHLFLHGGEIAFMLADAASEEQDKAFLTSVLKATYVKDSAGPRTIHGVPGDVVSGALPASVDIYGLDPVPLSSVPYNQPDELKVTGGSVPIMYYGAGTSQVAGLRWESKGSRLVYLGFGLENLQATDRAAITNGALTWFRTAAAVSRPNALEGFSLGQNYPNPFNPITTIPFSTTKAGIASLYLYDSRGVVRDRRSIDVTAGQQTLMLNAAGLSSGTYFYELRTAEGSIRKAMTVLK